MAKKEPAAQKNRIFNLLKPYIPPPTGWDRVYEWMLGRARVIMIVAEIIVALTFMGKVVIDTHAKNLEDQIKLRDFELQQFSVTVEPILRKLQNKGVMYTNLWNGSSKYSDIVAEIHSFLPNPGAEVLITLNKDEVSISGEESFAALVQIESAMKASTKFTEVSVTQLNTDTASAQGISGDYLLTAKVSNLKGRTQIKGQ